MKKIILTLICLISTISQSATININNSTIVNGDGQCDIVDAINSANTDTAIDGCVSGNLIDTINVPSNIFLTAIDNSINALPLITSNIVITSTSSVDRIVGRVGGSPNFRIFEVSNSGNLELINIAVSGGLISGVDGGCLYNTGSVTLTNSVIDTCTTDTKGGGLYSSGSLLMNVSTIRSSTATTGGAIYMDIGATSTINRSTITNNSSGVFAQNGSGVGSLNIFRTNILSNFGQGINSGTNTVIDRSSINQNNSEGLIFTTTDGNSFKLVNSTLSTNGFAGLDSLGTVSNVATITLSNNTFSGNGTGDGSPNLNFRSGILAVNNLNIHNNIFDNVFGPNECSIFANILSASNNISDDNTCPAATVSATINLNPLSSNVHFLGSGSSAQDAGNNTICSNSDVNNIDQRGTARPFNGICDIGSIESNLAPPSGAITLTKTALFVDANSDGFAQAGETISYSFSVRNTGSLVLSNVTISDPLISVPGMILLLPVGATDNTAFSGTYTLLQSDIDAGSVSNVATVNSTDEFSNSVTAQSNAGVALVTNLNVASAGITLTKAATFIDANSDGFAQAGETINYSFSVSNNGAVTLSNVTINDPLMSVPGTLATLNVGATDNSTFTGTYTLLQSDIDAGMVSNLATANALDSSSNAVTAQSNAGVALVTNLTTASAGVILGKSATLIDTNSDGFAQAGEMINYSFTVQNSGGVTLSNVTISDPLISVPGTLATLNVGATDNSTFTGTYTLLQ
ncbi:MAG: choice-of-anchor Q domain-containing protein, partial [Flavobacteriaceae bacterium]